MRGYLRDLGHGARITAADPVRRVLVLLGWGAAFVLIAPEAVALAYARDRGLSELAGSLLMATVPAGAALGAYLIGRIDPVRAVQMLLSLVALACLPLIATLADPPVLIAGLLWLISGTCQGFMVPLVTTVNLATPREQRGMVNGLAAAGFNVSTTAAFLVVGALFRPHQPGDRGRGRRDLRAGRGRRVALGVAAPRRTPGCPHVLRRPPLTAVSRE